MVHYETRKLVPGARYAVLFLHGIAGSPNQFRKLIELEKRVPENWSVFNVRYPGYGGTVTEFGKSNIQQWRSYARDAYLELAQSHEKVLIVGHSMGTLFAMEMALEFPETTVELFLLNVPLRPCPRLYFIPNCLRLAFNRIRDDHPREACFWIACGVIPTALVWQYISWIPRILELFGEIIRTEKVMGALAVPCIAWQSRNDDLVSNLTAPVLRRSGVMEVRELSDSTHFYYAPEDAKLIYQEFENIIKKVPG